MIPLKRNAVFLLFLVLAAMILVAGCTTGNLRSDTGGAMGTLTFYTEDNYPYNYLENGTLKGISPDLLEKITETMGDRVSRERIRLVAWSEGYQAALTGNNTMIFAIARIPSRETSFKWAGPIYPYTTVVFARPDSGIIISSPDDLKAYRIGAVTDDAAIQQLVDAGVNRSSIVQVPDEYMLINQIRNGTIDLWADSEISGRVVLPGR